LSLLLAYCVLVGSLIQEILNGNEVPFFCGVNQECSRGLEKVAAGERGMGGGGGTRRRSRRKKGMNAKIKGSENSDGESQRRNRKPTRGEESTHKGGNE
jgi:hypothetical protein